MPDENDKSNVGEVALQSGPIKLVTQFPRELVADLCRRYGPDLVDLPQNGLREPFRARAPIDPTKILWALAGCESSLGDNATPRHEWAYDVGGTYANEMMKAGEAFVAANLEKYADYYLDFGQTARHNPAAYSYGIFQVMYPVAVERGFFVAPWILQDPDINAIFAVAQLNHLLSRRKNRAETITELATGYNTGNPKGHVPAKYVKDFADYYITPMPARCSTLAGIMGSKRDIAATFDPPNLPEDTGKSTAESGDEPLAKSDFLKFAESDRQAGWDEIVGIEQDADYCAIGRARLEYWKKHEFPERRPAKRAVDNLSTTAPTISSPSTKQVEMFRVMKSPEARIYVCGPYSRGGSASRWTRLVNLIRHCFAMRRLRKKGYDPISSR